jgi:hypothetical protein
MVRIDLKHTLSGVNAVTRVFFSYGGTLSRADAQTWVDAIANAWKTNMLPQLQNRLVLTQTVLTDLTSVTSPQVVSAVTGAGGGTTNPAASGVALVIQKKIARRYRGGHPRQYIPGPISIMGTSSNTWDPTYAAAVIAAYSAFISAALTGVPAAASPATEQNVSYFTGFTNKTFPSGRVHAVPTARVTPISDLVLSNTLNPKAGSQRRRNFQSA